MAPQRKDALNGTAGDDVICGGGGADTIKGLGGNDILKGEGGADKLYGGTGDDTLDGGLGLDTANFSEATGRSDRLSLLLTRRLERAQTTLTGWRIL